MLRFRNYPLFQADAGSQGGESKGDNDGKNGAGANGDATGQKGGEQQQQSNVKTFTQDEIEAIVTDRLKRDRIARENDEKEKARKEQLPEIERLKAELADATNKLTERDTALRLRNAKDAVSESARKAGATDTTLIWKAVKDDLEYDDDGKVKNLDAALKDTKQLHPHLFKAPTGKADANAGNSNDRSKGKSPDWIRDLAKPS